LYGIVTYGGLWLQTVLKSYTSYQFNATLEEPNQKKPGQRPGRFKKSFYELIGFSILI